MNDDTSEKLTSDELAALELEPLPNREQMSVVHVGAEPLPPAALLDPPGGFTTEPMPPADV